MQEALPMSIEKSATGGYGDWQLIWQQSADTISWEPADGIVSASSTSYSPGTALASTYYRLDSKNECGDTYSNVLFMKVNPLPPLQQIEGDDAVCDNQYVVYEIQDVSDSYSYAWAVDGSVASLDAEPQHIEVLWQSQQSAIVSLTLTDNQTGCVSTNEKTVEVGKLVAPSRTAVVRKPNSDILVCEERSPDYIYTWGYTDRQNGQQTIMRSSSKRYVKLPHSYDNVRYDYWLNLALAEEPSCFSLSVYTEENNSLIVMPTVNKAFVSGPPASLIPLKVHNSSGNDALCSVYDTNGLLVKQVNLGPEPYVERDIEVTGQPGTYLVMVVIGDEVITLKTIVK